MKIAILGWGSLFWDPGSLATEGEWLYDGPELPLEFARISKNKRLTLVIKPNFDYVTTLFIVSSYQTLLDARENLALREGTQENINNIGYVDFKNNTHMVRPTNEFIIPILKNWNIGRNFDAIIWSDFSPRFTDLLGQPFTLENIKAYMDTLTVDEKKLAIEYIQRAPKQISTRFRAELENIS